MLPLSLLLGLIATRLVLPPPLFLFSLFHLLIYFCFYFVISSIFCGCFIIIWHLVSTKGYVEETHGKLTASLRAFQNSTSSLYINFPDCSLAQVRKSFQGRRKGRQGLGPSKLIPLCPLQIIALLQEGLRALFKQHSSAGSASLQPSKDVSVPFS